MQRQSEECAEDWTSLTSVSMFAKAKLLPVVYFILFGHWSRDTVVLPLFAALILTDQARDRHLRFRAATLL